MTYPRYMADPPCRRSTPEYHAFVAVRELPSLDVIVLLHPEDAERTAKALNDYFGEATHDYD